MAETPTLRDLLVHKLSLLSDIESHTASAMPSMIDRAHHQGLKAVFRDHLAETRNHVSRVESAFKLMRQKPVLVEVGAIRALLGDAEKTLEGVRGAHAYDAVLISYALWIEHIEIATYGVAFSWAEMLGEERVSRMLKDTLAEEESADKDLSEILEAISAKAAQVVAIRLTPF